MHAACRPPSRLSSAMVAARCVGMRKAFGAPGIWNYLVDLHDLQPWNLCQGSSEVIVSMNFPWKWMGLDNVEISGMRLNQVERDKRFAWNTNHPGCPKWLQDYSANSKAYCLLHNYSIEFNFARWLGPHSRFHPLAIVGSVGQVLDCQFPCSTSMAFMARICCWPLVWEGNPASSQVQKQTKKLDHLDIKYAANFKANPNWLPGLISMGVSPSRWQPQQESIECRLAGRTICHLTALQEHRNSPAKTVGKSGMILYYDSLKLERDPSALSFALHTNLLAAHPSCSTWRYLRVSI